MYEPYPTAAQSPQPPERGRPPASVQNAVRFMYAGAALSALEVIIFLATAGSLKSAIKTAYPHDTASQVHTLDVSIIARGIITGLIALGLWIWMARANATGYNYARIVGSVLFGLNTVSLAFSFGLAGSGLALVFNGLVWLAGLGAVVFLWRRESGPYFQRRPSA